MASHEEIVATHGDQPAPPAPASRDDEPQTDESPRALSKSNRRQSRFKLTVMPNLPVGPPFASFNSSSPLAHTGNKLSSWKTHAQDSKIVVARFGHPFSRLRGSGLVAVGGQRSRISPLLKQKQLIDETTPPTPEQIELTIATLELSPTCSISPPQVDGGGGNVSLQEFLAGDLDEEKSARELLRRQADINMDDSMPLEMQSLQALNLGQTESISSPSFDILLVKEQACLKQVAYQIIISSISPKVPLSKNILKEYIHEVSVHYRPNPFHNFHHAVNVLHFLSVMLQTTNANEVVTQSNYFAFLLSALVHDVDHPGKTNLFEINSASTLALLYNDSSVLENHHCSLAFRLMQKPGTNVLSRLPLEQRKDIRQTMICCILATDMSKHSSIIEEARKMSSLLCRPLDANEQMFMGKLFLHAADLSGPTKVFSVAREWATRVTAEFNAQVEVETAMGLPVLSFMTAADEQSFLKNEIGFSGFFVAPLWRIVSKLCPQLEFVHQQLEHNINQYKALKEEREKLEYDSNLS